MNHLPLLIRREFWEHRSFFIAPAVVAAILILIITFGHPQFRHASLDLVGNPEFESKRYAILTLLLTGVAVPYLISMGFLTLFYLLDSLYADRKDRSVLFWKSLPVSDRETVISKLVVAAVALPLMTFGAVLATNLLFGLIGSLRLSGTVEHVWSMVWEPRLWFAAHALILYSMATMTLWYLPILGWLLLVSAWARRAVILWAVLPILALMLLEYGFLQTFHVAHMLRDRFGGWFHLALNTNAAERAADVDGSRIPMTGRLIDSIDPGTFFSSPGLWIGLIVAAGFIWAAILLRRRRSET
ncbi:MAG TPA: ABC-2 transporter permease [Steroidobacteraceae bacterium]|nr:ABC-2 transporter permease [Steroidobacteraceae bacterium]